MTMSCPVFCMITACSGMSSRRPSSRTGMRNAWNGCAEWSVPLSCAGPNPKSCGICRRSSKKSTMPASENPVNRESCMMPRSSGCGKTCAASPRKSSGTAGSKSWRNLPGSGRSAATLPCYTKTTKGTQSRKKCAWNWCAASSAGSTRR